VRSCRSHYYYTIVLLVLVSLGTWALWLQYNPGLGTQPWKMTICCQYQKPDSTHPTRFAPLLTMNYYLSIFLSLGSKPVDVPCVSIDFRRLILFSVVLWSPHQQWALTTDGLVVNAKTVTVIKLQITSVLIDWITYNWHNVRNGSLRWWSDRISLQEVMYAWDGDATVSTHQRGRTIWRKESKDN